MCRYSVGHDFILKCQCYVDYSITESGIKTTISLKHQSDLKSMILGTRACF